MFGNRIGWGISVAMCVMFGGLMWIFVELGRISPPTSFSRDATLNQPIALPVAPTTIVTMDQPGDAGSLYRQAIADFNANTTRYEKLLKEARPDLNAQLPAIDALVQATHLRDMTLFERAPGDALAYTTRETANLKALGQIGELANRLALFHAVNGNKDRARELFHAVFALGAKLFNERVSYAELSTGMGLMAGSAEGMFRQIADDAEKERLTAFLDAYRALSPRLADVQKKINSIDPRISYRHAGDVYHIIRSSQIDRMWRAEALMKAGRYRFDAGRAADQRGALRLINPYTTSDDPVLRHAAVTARDLTMDQFKRLGS